MVFHLDRLTEDLIQQGYPPSEARREAVRRFGSREHVHSRSRVESGFALMDELARNVRFALRGIRRAPLHATIFVLTTALTVALGGLAWAVGDATLWRELPYPEPDRLVQVAMYDAEASTHPTITSVDGATWEAFRDNGPGYPSAVLSGWGTGVNLTAGGSAAFVVQQRVGAGYFDVLGVALQRGREFTPGEDVPGGPALAILSHDLWSDEFGADPEILESTILLKGEPHRVVGIVPETFRSPANADVWTPLRPSTTGEGSGTNYSIIARLPRGMDLDDAHRAVGSVAPAVAWAERPGDQRFGLLRYEEVLTRGVGTPLGVLIAGIGLMLIIGWSNLAGLQLARTLARRGEFHTRRALGGPTGALARQVVAETATVGALGGALGTALLVWIAPWVGALVQSRFGTWQPLPGAGALVAVAAILTAGAIVAAGIAPVLRVARSGTDGLVPSSRIRGRVRHAGRRALLVGQLGLATVLVFSAAVLARSHAYLEGLDRGFDAEGLLTVRYSLDDARFGEGDAVHALFERTVAELETRPEIRSAAVALSLPYERPLNLSFQLPGQEEYLVTNAVYVTPRFFEVMGIGLRSGRTFDARDGPDGPPVVVANQAFVDRYLPEREPLGAVVTMSPVGDVPVVGVVENVQQSAGWGDGSQPVWETPTLYLAAGQLPAGFFSGIHIWFAPNWIVRAEASAGSSGGGLAESVVPTIRSVAPELPVARIATMSEIVDGAFARQRLEATFLFAMAAVALLLTGIGLYGLIAQEVVERRGELGVRMALGATPGRAVVHIGSRGLRLAAAGVAIGIVLSIGASRVLESLIWGVGTLDPITLAGVVTALAGLTVVASFVPAARVARLDPARVLREE